MNAARSLVGMWIFLGSTTVLFCALLFCYAMLRMQNPGWSAAAGGVLPLGQATASTAALCASSAALAAGLRWLGRGDERARRAVAVALALGGAFVVLQGGVLRGAWVALGRDTLIEGLVRSLVLLLGGVHVAHVLAGLVALAITAVPVLRSRPRAFEVERLKLAAMFWHFVDLAWIAMFAILFLT